MNNLCWVLATLIICLTFSYSVKKNYEFRIEELRAKHVQYNKTYKGQVN